jgi:hypothetical protein
MKRSRINNKSDKRKQWDREWGPKRKAYVDSNACAVTQGIASEVHEIHGGSDRWQTYREPCMWLAVCRIAHDKVQYWPKAKQLALKLLVDYENFDLERFNELYRGGKEYPVSMQDVLSWLTLNVD